MSKLWPSKWRFFENVALEPIWVGHGWFNWLKKWPLLKVAWLSERTVCCSNTFRYKKNWKTFKVSLIKKCKKLFLIKNCFKKFQKKRKVVHLYFLNWQTFSNRNEFFKFSYSLHQKKKISIEQKNSISFNCIKENPIFFWNWQKTNWCYWAFSAQSTDQLTLTWIFIEQNLFEKWISFL